MRMIIQASQRRERSSPLPSWERVASAKREPGEGSVPAVDADPSPALARLSPPLVRPLPQGRGEARKVRRFNQQQRYGDTSSSTRPFVSMAKAAVMTAATSAAVANIQNTDCKPPAIMKPTAVGPIIEAKRSHAVTLG